MSLTVVIPEGPEELDHVRTLKRAFIAWHKDRHRDEIHLIESYFDAAAYDRELASLPGEYVPPKGQLLLAMIDGAPAGCVAMRDIDEIHCEMKRMFVYPKFHGQGVGRALAGKLIEAARGLGYGAMRLDTSIRQDEAMGLYRRLGFKAIPPYCDLPLALQNWLVFMELAL